MIIFIVVTAWLGWSGHGWSAAYKTVAAMLGLNLFVNGLRSASGSLQIDWSATLTMLAIWVTIALAAFWLARGIGRRARLAAGK